MVKSDSAAICVVGAVIRGGRVLLVRRSPSARFYPDVWDLFGGHVDGGESLEEALRREAREELGIEVLALRWLGQVYDPVEPAVVYVSRSHRGKESLSTRHPRSTRRCAGSARVSFRRQRRSTPTES